MTARVLDLIPSDMIRALARGRQCVGRTLEARIRSRHDERESGAGRGDRCRRGYLWMGLSGARVRVLPQPRQRRARAHRQAVSDFSWRRSAQQRLLDRWTRPTGRGRARTARRRRSGGAVADYGAEYGDDHEASPQSSSASTSCRGKRLPRSGCTRLEPTADPERRGRGGTHLSLLCATRSR